MKEIMCFGIEKVYSDVYSLASKFLNMTRNSNKTIEENNFLLKTLVEYDDLNLDHVVELIEAIDQLRCSEPAMKDVEMDITRFKSNQKSLFENHGDSLSMKTFNILKRRKRNIHEMIHKHKVRILKEITYKQREWII